MRASSDVVACGSCRGPDDRVAALPAERARESSGVRSEPVRARVPPAGRQAGPPRSCVAAPPSDARAPMRRARRSGRCGERESCSRRVVRSTGVRCYFSVRLRGFAANPRSVVGRGLASWLLHVPEHDSHGLRDPTPPSVAEPAAHPDPRATRCRNTAAGEQPNLGPPRAWPPPLRLLRASDPRLRRGVRGARPGQAALRPHAMLPRLGGGVAAMQFRLRAAHDVTVGPDRAPSSGRAVRRLSV